MAIAYFLIHKFFKCKRMKGSGKKQRETRTIITVAFYRSLVIFFKKNLVAFFMGSLFQTVLALYLCRKKAGVFCF
jgi:hypothetical protein